MQLEDYENFEKTHPSSQAASTASAWSTEYVAVAPPNRATYDYNLIMQQWLDARRPAGVGVINGIGLDNPQE